MRYKYLYITRNLRAVTVRNCDASEKRLLTLMPHKLTTAVGPLGKRRALVSYPGCFSKSLDTRPERNYIRISGDRILPFITIHVSRLSLSKLQWRLLLIKVCQWSGRLPSCFVGYFWEGSSARESMVDLCVNKDIPLSRARSFYLIRRRWRILSFVDW